MVEARGIEPLASFLGATDRGARLAKVCLMVWAVASRPLARKIASTSESVVTRADMI